MQKVSDEVLGRFARQQADAFWRVREGLLDPDAVSEAIQDLIQPKILRRLYGDEVIMVGATDGTETIADAGDVFTGWLDPDFKEWGIDKSSGVATKAAPVEVRELNKNATFGEVFGSLGKIKDLCLTQGQIIDFCREHRDKLRQGGYCTFFLLVVEDVPFVADAYVDSDELKVCTYRFENDGVWDAGDRHRVVVPQQELGR